MMAAINSTPSGSIAALADTCGIDRPQVHASIREGRCSQKMALKIEKACGRSVVRREWLMFPLEIEELTTQ
jgi:plasmid maintenance system antidote protein VapI